MIAPDGRVVGNKYPQNHASLEVFPGFFFGLYLIKNDSVELLLKKVCLLAQGH